MTKVPALLLAMSMSGCMSPGKLPTTTASDFRSVEKIALLPVAAPAVPRVRILNSNSDWFHIPGFVAKGTYVSHVGAEVGSLLESVSFDYEDEAARRLEQSIVAAGVSIARTGVTPSRENRNWPMRKCPVQIEADACFDLILTYFGYVAASDSADYVPTAHLSARIIRARDRRVLFERNIHYNPIDPGKAIDVFASAEFRFHDLDAMKADPPGVAAGLRTALDAVAAVLETELRNALK